MNNKPYYFFKINAVNCIVEIRINDIVILFLNIEDQASFSLPFNYAILKSGEQKVNAKALPIVGETTLKPGAKLEYSIEKYDVSHGFELEEEFLEYKSPEIKEGQTEFVFLKEDYFNVIIPYQMNIPWINGKKLKDIKNIEEKLREEYVKLGNLVKAKKYELLKEKMKLKEDNIAASMYLRPVDSKARMNSLVIDFENGFDQMDLAKELVIVYSAEGKIASLKRLTGEPALCFYKKKPFEQLFLDFDFY
jgi:hypothetical protein